MVCNVITLSPKCFEHLSMSVIIFEKLHHFLKTSDLLTICIRGYSVTFRKTSTYVNLFDSLQCIMLHSEFDEVLFYFVLFFVAPTHFLFSFSTRQDVIFWLSISHLHSQALVNYSDIQRHAAGLLRQKIEYQINILCDLLSYISFVSSRNTFFFPRPPCRFPISLYMIGLDSNIFVLLR